MERPNAWKSYTGADLSKLEELCGSYRSFISAHKTERECVTGAIGLARQAGYIDLADAVRSGQPPQAR